MHEIQFNQFSFIDMTHELNARIPSWDGGCGFSHANKIDYQDCATEVQFRVQQISMQAGIGTHVDAPAHCIPGGQCVGDIPLSQLIAPCVVLDVSFKANAEYLLSPQEILAFETTHGPLQAGEILLIHTGWEKYWSEPQKYRNEMKFPSISAESAEILKIRRLSAVGIDTLGIDRPISGFPAHQILLGAGIILIENVKSMMQMPVRGGFILCLPIKGEELTEAPVRLIGVRKQEAH